MKRVLLLIASLQVFGLMGTAQRLPELAAPENYSLTFAPNFTKDNFAGDETISIRVLKPTAEIVLNSAQIDFQSASISSGGKTQNATVTTDPAKEFATLKFSDTIQPGPATIHIVYRGILNGDLRGFYLGKEANGKKYAVTQFESTDARRAFPCFDEPDYKATADITVITDKDKIAISNQKVISDVPGPGPDKHTVKFATTAKMSSYLYAVAVGDFEYIEGSADGIPIRVYTFPGRKEQGRFGLQVAEYCLKYYDKYFGVKYAFTKLDLIGLPDFAAGAMENAGAITFREVALLIDEKSASTQQKKRVATTITHEIAHQWFGDLVTMKWWDDIWLNEGFATWMETKPVAAWRPDWDMNLDDVLDTSNTMTVDSLATTRPIHQAAETPEQIQELFDGIAYGKAASVLRMLEAYLGPETFRKGVDSYIKQHAYGNSTAEDFWSALAEASNKPVDQIMPTFVKQVGLPMVSLKSSCEGKTTRVTLSQQRYFFDRSRMDEANDELWQVPVCMKSQDGDTSACELLTKKEDEFTLPGCSPWVLANANATGYYRSHYDSDAVRALSNVAQDSLSPAERIRLISDEWATVRVNLGSINDFMVLMGSLKSEHNGVVMQQGAGQIQFIADALVTDADRPAFQQWVRDLFNPLAKELGWQPVPGDSDDRKTLRAAVFEVLGNAGRDPQVLAQAGKLAREAFKNPDAVDASMAGTVFHLAALTGDAAFYDGILAAMPKSRSPEEFYRLGGALTDFTDPALLDRTLKASLTPAIRTQDAPYVIAAVLRNPAGRATGWNFVRAHWAEIDKMMIGFSAGTVIGATGSFCDAGQEAQVKDFFAANPVPSAERTLKQAEERIGYCVQMKEQQSPQVAAWLGQHAPAAGN
jgi:aminopeptidase N/puromycin-sensitive aminopeptidase